MKFFYPLLSTHSAVLISAKIRTKILIKTLIRILKTAKFSNPQIPHIDTLTLVYIVKMS